MAYYLAIDLGTTGCRSILFDDKLNNLSQAYEEYGLITPNATWVEQDAELWWTLTKKTAKDAISEAGIDGKAIDGISISSQGITIVPVDRDFKPLCNAQSWLDSRGETEAEQIAEDYTVEGIFGLTGKNPLACYTLPKLLWIRKNMPDIWEKAYKFLMPMDFLTAKLCGRAVTDHSMASGTLMYDLKAGCWSRDVLDRYSIEEERLPEILWSGESAGCVLPEVAKELGLRADCVVAVGAQDQKCAALGAGLKEGAITVSLGTAGAITKRWSECLSASNQSVAWCGYTEKGYWVTEGVIETAGVCLRYTRDLIYPGESYKIIDEESAEAIEWESELLFLPSLGAGKGGFYGMGLGTAKGEYTAAVMQGVAFEVRRMLQKMDAYGNIDTLILFGGGAKGDLWCQIVADATNMNILVPKTAEAAGAGAAVLAARGCGVDLGSLECTRSYKPSDERREYYEKKFARYEAALKALGEV